MTNRRHFIAGLGLASIATLFSREVLADAVPVSEADPTAVALGYKADGSKVDLAKFPRYASAQKCMNCALYQGKAGDKAGPCSMFGGRMVASTGWCNAWTKKN